MATRRNKQRKIVDALGRVLLEMAQEKGAPFLVREVGLLVYIKDDKLHLEWEDGFVICKDVAAIATPASETR